MKKLTITIALTTLLSLSVFAHPVDVKTAQKVATTFLNNNGAKSTQLTDLSKAAGFQNLYIFSAEDGFVVMAADNCVKPILGYSLTGSFSTEEMPENVREWLQGYNDEIQYAIENQMRATSETAKQWEDLAEGKPNVAKATTVVAPLIQTKWNQNEYYNNLCPPANGGPNGLAYTGCTATSMAQIMKYYNYPPRGISSHSYEWNGQILSADFGATTYDWNNMTNYYYYYYDDNGTFHWIIGNSTDQEILAVATLMYHCGVSTNMNYSGSGSGASLSNAANALKNYFNYSFTIEFKRKSNYEDTEWKTMVKNELNANRPLQYAGYNPAGSGGHAFVCDGYNSSDFFHFNWGWAGHYDGYFSLDNLNTGANSSQPGAGNGVYTRDQEAIFGIKPSTNNAIPNNLTYTLNGLQDITLNWTGAAGATSYNVYRNGNLIGNVTGCTFSDTAPFGTNVYYVRSLNSAGELSLATNSITVTIAYQQPIVNDLTAALSGNNVSLSWTAPEWCYPETPSATLNYGNENLYYSWSYMYYAHRHLAADLAQYAGKAVYKVSTYIKYPGTYSLYVYSKSTANNKPDPNSLSANINLVPVTISNDWYEFVLSQPVILTGTDDLWVVIKQQNTNQTNPTPSFNLTTHNTNAFYASSNSPTNLYDANSGYNCAWFINVYLTDGIYTYNLYRNNTKIAQNLSQTTYNNATLNNNTANVFTVKTNYYGGETEASNKIGFAKGTASLSSLNLGENDKMTVMANSKLTVSGSLGSSNTANLVLEDGAQLVHNSSGVMATVKKNIARYTNDDNGWHFITNPVIGGVVPSASNGLLNGNTTSNSYDLYYYNEPDNFWKNYEENTFSLNHNQGYLYANGQTNGTTLTFAGELQPSGSNFSLTAPSYNAGDLAGFNLVGNPFVCNASVNKDYYVIDNTNHEIILAPAGRKVAPCEGIFVQFSSLSDAVVFSKSASKGTTLDDAFDLVLSRGQTTIDRVRARFGEGEGMEKTIFNGNCDMLCIKQGETSYAVAYLENKGETSLNVKVSTNGTYTISFETETNRLTYLHLIDQMTGKEIDLLAEPSYTFEAQTADDANRFKLVYSIDGNK